MPAMVSDGTASAGRFEAMGESRSRWPSVVESVQNPVVEKEVLAAQVEAVRAEGGHASWGYHSRASLAHRYVAMTVPKVACTTIKMALQTWEGCGPRPERWADVHADWAGPTLAGVPDGPDCGDVAIA
jgi:hypothetical protein